MALPCISVVPSQYLCLLCNSGQGFLCTFVLTSEYKQFFLVQMNIHLLWHLLEGFAHFQSYSALLSNIYGLVLLKMIGPVYCKCQTCSGTPYCHTIQDFCLHFLIIGGILRPPFVLKLTMQTKCPIGKRSRRIPFCVRRPSLAICFWLWAVENEEPEADARRFHTEMFLLMINRRKTCSRVVALVGLKFVVNKSR